MVYRIVDKIVHPQRTHRDAPLNSAVFPKRLKEKREQKAPKTPSQLLSSKWGGLTPYLIISCGQNLCKHLEVQLVHILAPVSGLTKIKDKSILLLHYVLGIFRHFSCFINA